MEKSYFWWFCWLGLGNPCHIATKTPLEKLHQNLGLADPHPPQLGQKTKFFDRSNLRAPLRLTSSSPFDFWLIILASFFTFLIFTLCWLLTSSSPLHSSGQSTVSSRRVQRIVSSPFQIYPSFMRWQWWSWLIYHFVSSDLSEKPLQDALARQ